MAHRLGGDSSSLGAIGERCGQVEPPGCAAHYLVACEWLGGDIGEGSLIPLGRTTPVMVEVKQGIPTARHREQAASQLVAGGSWLCGEGTDRYSREDALIVPLGANHHHAWSDRNAGFSSLDREISLENGPGVDHRNRYAGGGIIQRGSVAAVVGREHHRRLWHQGEIA